MCSSDLLVGKPRRNKEKGIKLRCIQGVYLNIFSSRKGDLKNHEVWWKSCSIFSCSWSGPDAVLLTVETKYFFLSSLSCSRATAYHRFITSAPEGTSTINVCHQGVPIVRRGLACGPLMTFNFLHPKAAYAFIPNVLLLFSSRNLLTLDIFSGFFWIDNIQKLTLTAPSYLDQHKSP